jgi:pimeloyl-ACP methyl ester carboxylesterase
MMGKRWLVVTVVSAVTLTLLIGGQQGVAAPGMPKISWSPCNKQLGPFECGTVQVPLDYDSSAGGTISIALARLPASDPARRIGSLFINPGGPGGSGIDVVLGAGPFLYSDEVRARFDIVGFDPRGIIRSTAFRCFGNEKQWEPFFTPYAFPSTPEEQAVWEAADRYLDGACARRGGAIGDHMSTANVARDLDALRQAVGDDQLTYVGYSYGSFLGVTYANLFPDKVRALVIDGVLDPIAWTTGVGNEGATTPFSTRLRSDAGAQATLDEFFRLCDAGTCAFGPGSAARFAALVARLKADPTVMHFSVLIGMTLGAMYDSSSWEEFAALLADIEAATSSSPALRARVNAFLNRPLYISKRAFPQYPNFVEGFPAVACADSDNPDAYASWASAAASSIGTFGPLWTWVSSICAEWPTADSDRYMGPFTARTANPVLVVGNLFDPATRYEGAQTVAELLPNSRLLTVNGWGHTSLFISACADDAVSSYLLTSIPPPAGKVCPQDFTPFSG